MIGHGPISNPDHICVWKETGRRRYVAVEYTNGMGETARHDYVRCEICKRVGFRRNGRKVVYTWEQSP